MRIKDVIRAPKTDVVFDPWETTRMGKSAFPLSRSGHSAQLGAGFQWCKVKFTALGRDYRMLVAVDFSKLQYYAYLGEVHGTDTKMLASYEYHGTHGGWHVHAACGDMALIPVGRYKGDWKRMIPADWHTCRQTAWDVANQDIALRKACEQFGVSMAGTQGQLL